MINKIIVKNFKCIKEVELTLSGINILLGSNNSGKSSFLQAIQFAVSVAQTGFYQGAHWRSSEDRFPLSISPSDLVYSPLKDVYSLAPEGKLQETIERAISVEFIESSKSAKVIVRKGRNRNITTSIEGKELGVELQNVDSPFSIIVPGLAGIPAFENYFSPSIVRRAAARGDANSVFRNILYQLAQDENSWEKFQSTLASIFDDISLKVDYDQDRDEHIGVYIENNGNVLPIDSSGTGVLQAIQILSYIYLYDPKILILDEPDSHLHPNNQKLIVGILKKINDENATQILISTHSKYLVEEFQEDANIFWINDGQIVENEDNYLVKSLLDIGALSKGDISLDDSKLIVLTEDSEQKYIRMLLEANSFPLEEIEIWPYKGCSSISVAQALIKYIHSKNTNIQILIHRDRDFFTDKEVEAYKTKLEERLIKVFIPEGNDLEYYFFMKEHFLEIYSELSEEDYDEIVEQAIDNRKDNLIEKFINTKIDNSYKKQEKPNAGNIAVSCQKMFEDDSLKYSHGKILLKSVNNVIQERLKENSKLVRISDKLVIPELQDLQKAIWQVSN